MSARELVDGEPTLYAESVDAWRAWLAKHGEAERAVWLIVHHKDSGVPSAGYREAVEHALCFGWIDSKAISRDGRSTYQRFTPRGPRSTWSAVNRERARRLTAAGLMTARGQAAIDVAKATGRWDVLGGAPAGVVPDDLCRGLDADPVRTAR